jgi:hypothetical protein
MNRLEQSKVPRSVGALIFTLTTLFVHASARAQPASPNPNPHDRNAALQYWQAFAILPVMSDAERQLAGAWQSAPLNAATDKLIQASGPALKQLHRGSICNRCDWGLNKEDSFNLRLPHLVKARELARLAFLRARQRMGAGQNAQATDDIIDTLILARRAGADDILIGILVQASIEQMAVEAVVPHLGTFSKADLATLSTRLAQLPPGGSIQGSVVWEREYGLLSLIAQLKAARTSAEPWEPYLARVLGLPIETIRAAGGTPQSLAENLEKLRPIYDAFPAALKLPQSQARARLAELKKQADANPLKSVVPDFSRFYDRYGAVQTRLTLLHAAIAILQSGPDQLKNFPDPYTQEPIDYTPGQHGAFTLTSKFTEAGKPVTLTVGPTQPAAP